MALAPFVRPLATSLARYRLTSLLTFLFVMVVGGTSPGPAAFIVPRTSVVKLAPSGGGYAENILHSFPRLRDGRHPSGGLIADDAGALYGATHHGGVRGSACGDSGCGTIFKLTPLRSGYTKSVLYRFQGGSDGVAPGGSLIAGKMGTLYGTTLGGGVLSCPFHGGFGCGTVFKLTPSGTGYVESILYRFQGGSDGASPDAVLVSDKTGALYGTTQFGGSGTACEPGCGTVFKLAPSGSGYVENVIYSFQGGSDGELPIAGLVADKAGALYGTASFGGSLSCRVVGCGTVFKLTPSGSGYAESDIYRFQGGNDGRLPGAGLVTDNTGALYGTTYGGGGSCDCGAVFKLAPSVSGYTESILYGFQGGIDGETPVAALFRGKTGALYGTTSYGGTGCDLGCGTVFKLTPSGSGYTESVLYRFQGDRKDGANPQASLIADETGALYGTTYYGGRGSCSFNVAEPGCGTAFKLTPSGGDSLVGPSATQGNASAAGTLTGPAFAPQGTRAPDRRRGSRGVAGFGPSHKASRRIDRCGAIAPCTPAERKPPA
jgi:uncharacterized repeat protein (TIGR03803 family)